LHIYLLWEPRDVPSAKPFRIFYNQLEALKIQSCHRIEANIE
jgi:hypothetical protein